MAANTSPIFSKAPLNGISSINPFKTADTTTGDLSGANVALLFTADATNGSYVDKIIVQPLGTNIATVLRIWINNGGTNSTVVNNSQIKDVTMAATTVSQTAAIGTTEITLGFALPASYRIYATLGTTVSAGFNALTVAGQY